MRVRYGNLDIVVEKHWCNFGELMASVFDALMFRVGNGIGLLCLFCAVSWYVFLCKPFLAVCFRLFVRLRVELSSRAI